MGLLILLHNETTTDDDATFTALIRIGDADRARKEVRSTLRKLDALLLKTPYEFQDIRLASEEVIQAIGSLGQAYAPLEKTKK